MKKTFSLLGALFVAPLLAVPAYAAVDFVKDIKPVLEQSCIRCHSGPKAKGGLNLETNEGLLKGSEDGKVVVPGKAAESKLFKAIIAPKTDENCMPPEGDRLAKSVTDKFQAWIDEGAKWPQGVVIKTPGKDGPKAVVVDEPGVPISPGEKAAVDKLEKAGVFVMRLAQNTNYLRVDFTHRGKDVKDDELLLLKDMPNLVELNLGGLNISDTSLAHIKPLKNLVRLQLHKTKITDRGLANLEGMAKLVSLNLYGTDVTDAGIQQLKGCKELKRLFVWQTKVTETGAKQLAVAIPGIDINRGYELPPEPKKEEIKKDEPKKDAKKDEAKKDEPKKDEPKKDLKKDEPKKDEPKKDEPKKELKKDEPAASAMIEKRIAELESQLAPLQQELQKLRRQLHEQSAVTVIPLKFADAVQAAEVLEKVYRQTPGIVVEALPKIKGIAVRADKQTTNEIRNCLRHFDDAAQGRVGGAQQAPVRLDDMTIAVELIRWLDTRRP